MYGSKLDNIDIEITRMLQQNARTKRSQLAEHVGLSIPSISERLHKLETHGIIRGYFTLLDPRKIDLEVRAFIFLTSESSSYYAGIIDRVRELPEILECHAITGDGSHLLKVQVQNTAHLERLLSAIQSWPGVKDTRTDVVLSTPKETTEMPLNHLVRESRPSKK